jgi:molybdopterin-dependent oxidoreductase alpha subunit
VAVIDDDRHGDVSALTPESLSGARVTGAADKAAGLPGVVRAVRYVWRHAGAIRGARALSQLNQHGGIDCMSCAWPEPDVRRSVVEFCENGAKALGHELDRRRCDPAFFAAHTVADLSARTDQWLEQQGRLTHPMVLRAGATHYEPIAWADAFATIASALNDLGSPDEAAFYTSGRTSNEAAFAYQLFVRQFGTNNLPDCSNMCHESSGTALLSTIGIGKGTVTLDDFPRAQLILVVGQNPGTNHPRMLTTLQKAREAGARIVAVNPLKEAGLLGFMNPQQPAGMFGIATPLAEQFVQVKINGDVALFKGVMKALRDEERRRPGTVFDRAFIDAHTDGVDALVADLDAASWDRIVEDSGITREAIDELADRVARAERIIVCWAMGLTQHANAVATIQEIVNLLLLRGSIGKRGAGVCPVRGHSNVQGDRTMGIWEQPPAHLLDALAANFGFSPPRRHGYDTVATIGAMHVGRVKVFVQLGGNFLSAAPDTLFVQEALSRLRLSVRVGTKLNRSDLVVGREALLLPCLGRSEIDRQAGTDHDQFVTTENSMGVVETSRGRFEPASPELRSEVAIVCGLAQATLGGRSSVSWSRWAEDYDAIRDAIARTIRGCEDYNRRVREPGGFYLPNAPRMNQYPTSVGRARFTVNGLPERRLAPDELVMMTIRSHGQFNTTIYELDDPYRGIHHERRVVFMHADDIAARDLSPREVVDLTSRFEGRTRIARRFVVVPYDIPRGCCATYFPEGNVLVPVQSVSDRSHQPTSKYVAVTIGKSSHHEGHEDREAG